MRPQIFTTTALTNDPDGIFEDQTTAGAGSLTLDGALVESGVAYCYGSTGTTKQGQLIAIEGTGNNSGVVATITGTFGGATVTEDVTLANNGTATSSNYFNTVSSITVDGAVTGNIEGGWLSASTDAAATLAYKTDSVQNPFNASLAVTLSSGASLTYTVQHTFDLPQEDYGDVGWDNSATWFNSDGITSKTANDNSNYAFTVQGTRLVINSYTSGTAKYTYTQAYGNSG
jgi:hypothetical protein